MRRALPQGQLRSAHEFKEASTNTRDGQDPQGVAAQDTHEVESEGVEGPRRMREKDISR